MLDICIIIDADIYGIIPRAKIPNLESAPPENKLKSASILPACWSKKAASAAGSTPGTGINVPALNIINAPARNKNRELNSPLLLLVFASA